MVLTFGIHARALSLFYVSCAKLSHGVSYVSPPPPPPLPSVFFFRTLPPTGCFFCARLFTCTQAKFWKVLCDEKGVGGGGEHCGDNDPQLGRIDVFYHEASGEKYAPRAVLFDLEPGVIGAVTLICRSANSSARKTT